jgi:DNA primase
MFTINDRRGRAIAFGGRVMGQGEPKYLNSPETPLFHKGANLYCLDRARVAATKDQPVIVSEGYMDVIALHGAGFTGAVAPLGTALTEGQLGEIWKLADEPYLCFDGDNAGRRAAQRAADRALPLLRAGKSLRFLALPAGEDPDSLIRARGPDAITGVLKLARPLSDVLWDMETEGKPADTPERRASIRRALMARADQIADPDVRGYYRTDFRERLDKLYGGQRKPWTPGPRRFSAQRFGDRPPSPFAPGMAARQATADLDSSPEERALLGALIERPAMLHVLAEEVHRLPIPEGSDIDRLRCALLDALALLPSGIDPAAEEAIGGDTPLEERLILEHLERAGLGRLAASAQSKARRVFQNDPTDPGGWIGQWRHAASQLGRRMTGPEELKQAEAALAENPSQENWENLQAILARMQRERMDSGSPQG